jgi:hypothetical protein
VRLIYSTSDAVGCFAKVPREPVPPQGTLRVPVVIPAAAGEGRDVTLQLHTDLALQPTLGITVRTRPDKPSLAAGPIADDAGARH